MQEKIRKLLSRLTDVEEQLGHHEVFDDKKKYRELTQEHAFLSDIKVTWQEIQHLEKQLEDNRELMKMEEDPEFTQVLQEDIGQLENKLAKKQSQLKNLIIPPDPNDHRNTILELRAGTGGEEAALFVADCVRMYKLYADHMGWRYEELSSTPSDMGGYKEYVMVLSGSNVNRFLRYEGGTHRVQRVPETEAQGRIHTSAITIAVLLEPEEKTEVVIDEKELRIDTYRASGAGGQHVNVTDSAVRITHIPTGIVSHCQEERSQHKNKEKAMRLLKAKIAEVESQKKEAERATDRKEQVGTGDRSERIRTYNFPQNRVTDHRINLTLYNLDRVIEGDLDEVTGELVAHFQSEELKKG